MKQGTVFTKTAMLVLLAGVLLYLGAYLWNSLTDSFSTTYAYSCTVDDGLELTGLLVREETVLAGRNGIVDLIPDEGEKVGVGQTVARIYTTNEAVERKNQIAALELTAQQLSYAMSSGDNDNAAKLDEDILADVIALRACASTKEFSTLDDQILDLKSTLLRREYTYGDGGDLSSQLTQVSSEIKTLKSQSTQDTSTVTTSVSGIFSVLVDGYEGLLTPAALDDFTLPAVNSLLTQQVTGDATALGKLITSDTWYFLTTVDADAAARLQTGHTFPVTFSRDYSGELPMKVDRIGTAEDGQAVLVLSCDRGLSDTTLLRKQTVELILNRDAGIRVPKAALRVSSDGSAGVYVLTGAQAEYKAVTVLADGSDFYVVRSVATDKTALRDGDAIITTADGLYDGKVVR